MFMIFYVFLSFYCFFCPFPLVPSVHEEIDQESMCPNCVSFSIGATDESRTRPANSEGLYVRDEVQVELLEQRMKAKRVS